jgi:hypothetical protein
MSTISRGNSRVSWLVGQAMLYSIPTSRNAGRRLHATWSGHLPIGPVFGQASRFHRPASRIPRRLISGRRTHPARLFPMAQRLRSRASLIDQAPDLQDELRTCGSTLPTDAARPLICSTTTSCSLLDHADPSGSVQPWQPPDLIQYRSVRLWSLNRSDRRHTASARTEPCSFDLMVMAFGDRIRPHRWIRDN